MQLLLLLFIDSLLFLQLLLEYLNLLQMLLSLFL